MVKPKHVECRKCERERAEFLLVDGVCDICRLEAIRAKDKPHECDMDDIRAERNRRLNATDWSQLDDVPANTRQRWKAYRQALRDLPMTNKNPKQVVWPEPPE